MTTASLPKPSFFVSHIQRCEDLLERRSDISSVVDKLRAVIDAQSEETGAKILKRAAREERAPFTALAAEAIDRRLPSAADGTKASNLEVNKGLLDFVSLVSPNIRLRARAGSGKSTAIVIKCDFLVNALGVAPETIQVLTFNKAAATDLSRKLKDALGPEVGGKIGVSTFHSLAYWVLKTCPETRHLTLKFKEEDRSQKEQLSDLKISVMRNFSAQDFRVYCSRYEGTGFQFLRSNPGFENQVRDFITGAASLYRARRGTPKAAKASPITRHLARVVEAYGGGMAETNVIDGEAGLRKAAELLSGHADISTLKRLDGALKYLFVDEYQDFSAAFEALTRGVLSRNPSCVINTVGDDWQSINSFMGADLSFFTGFRKTYPAALNLPLQTNWRCGKRIVQLGNAVMRAKESEQAVAGLPHEGKIRVKTGGINDYRRKKDEWHEEARVFLEEQIATMARYAWADDARAGREPGTMVLLAAKNEPFGQSLRSYAKVIDLPEGMKVDVSTTHASKGREWDHVILLDGIVSEYPASHPADPVTRDMISTQDKAAEGQRLLYVAVTRAKHSLAILAPTELHPRLLKAREFAKL